MRVPFVDYRLAEDDGRRTLPSNPALRWTPCAGDDMGCARFVSRNSIANHGRCPMSLNRHVRRGLCFILTALLAGPMFAQEPKPRTPNVIILLADDLGYGDLACY